MYFDKEEVHKLLEIKAVLDCSALLLAYTTANLISFATASDGKKTQQTVVQKTTWKIIKTLFFRNANLCPTLQESIKHLFTAI